MVHNHPMIFWIKNINRTDYLKIVLTFLKFIKVFNFKLIYSNKITLIKIINFVYREEKNVTKKDKPIINVNSAHLINRSNKHCLIISPDFFKI